jgi:hypothetical protein
MPVDRVASLLTNMRQSDLAVVSPAERQRFASLCERWARIARQMDERPKVGVLHALQFARGHE